MASVSKKKFVKTVRGGEPVEPDAGTSLATLQDIKNFMFLPPLQTTGANAGFGTHPVPLEVKNTAVDWRTGSSGWGPVPYRTDNAGFVGYLFQYHNARWDVARAFGYTDPAILQCSIELECPRVWHRKDGVWSIAMTNKTPSLPIDGALSTLGTPNGGYWKTRNTDGTNNFAEVTGFTAAQMVSFLAGTDESGSHIDGHRHPLAPIVDPDGSPAENGEAELIHSFYPDAFFPRVKYPQNSDGTAGEVLIFSRARLVGPPGVDLRKVAVEVCLSADAYESPDQGSVGTTPGGAPKNPGLASPVRNWVLDPNHPTAVYEKSAWAPFGVLLQVPLADINALHTASPIPVVAGVADPDPGTDPTPTGDTTARAVYDMFGAPLKPGQSDAVNGLGAHEGSTAGLVPTTFDWAAGSARKVIGPYPTDGYSSAAHSSTDYWTAHNVWGEGIPIAGVSHAVTRVCRVQIEAPKVWHLSGGTWIPKRTTEAQIIGGMANPVRAFDAGMFQAQPYKKNLDIHSPTEHVIKESIGWSVPLSLHFNADGTVRVDRAIFHFFFPGGFDPRILFEPNCQVAIYSRARLIGPAGTDFSKANYQIRLSGDLFLTPESSGYIGPSGNIVNPAFALPRWRKMTGQWMPFGHVTGSASQIKEYPKLPWLP